MTAPWNETTLPTLLSNYKLENNNYKGFASNLVRFVMKLPLINLVRNSLLLYLFLPLISAFFFKIINFSCALN